MEYLKRLGLVAALALLFGCRGGDTGPDERGAAPTNPTHVVYSIDNDRDRLSTFWTDADGRLYPHDPPGGPLPTSPNPLDLAIDRSANRLYSIGGYSSNCKVGLFNLGLDGTPTIASAPAWPMSSPPGAEYLIFVPSFKFVFLSDSYNQVVDGYKVQADGTFTLNNPVGGAVVTGWHGYRMIADPTGQFLFVACNEAVWSYKIGLDGTLQLNNPAQGPADVGYATDLCVAPSGRWVYVVHSASGTVSLLNIQADGTLSPSSLPLATVSTGSQPWRLVMDNAGRYAYCVNHGSNSVSAFRVNPNGTLLRNDAGGVPISTGSRPVELAVDPEGKTLYVANQDGGSISVFRIGADGSLSLLQAPVPAGINPEKIVVR